MNNVRHWLSGLLLATLLALLSLLVLAAYAGVANWAGRPHERGRMGPVHTFAIEGGERLPLSDAICLRYIKKTMELEGLDEHEWMFLDPNTPPGAMPAERPMFPSWASQDNVWVQIMSRRGPIRVRSINLEILPGRVQAEVHVDQP